MPKLSIIIPVYNVEKYIRECLDSVKKQTFKNFEVILINDGSQDNSGAICDEYAATDSRFKVFHKENGGVASARNLGLDNANGEWVTFVDPDDCLVSDKVYEEIFALDINDVDMVKFQLVKGEILADTIVQENPMQKPMNERILREEQFKSEIYSYGNIWNMIMRRNIIGDLRFENIHIGEDGLFMRIAMLGMDRIMEINKAYYFYRYNPNSATRTYKPTDLEDRLFYTTKLKSVYEKSLYYDEERYNEYILITFVHAVGFEMRNLDARSAAKRIKEFAPKFGLDKVLTWKKVFESGIPVRLSLKIGAYRFLHKYIQKRLS